MKNEYAILKNFLKRTKIPFFVSFLILLLGSPDLVKSQVVTGTSVCEGSTLTVGINPSKYANNTFGLYLNSGGSYTKVSELYTTVSGTFGPQTAVGTYEVWSFPGFPPAPSDPTSTGTYMGVRYIWANPVPNIYGNTVPCYNTTVQYSSESGMTSYDWTVTNGNISAGGDGNNYVDVLWDVATGPGSISVTYTDGNGCTPNTPTVLNVDVKALPTPTISGNDPVCASSTHTYTTESGMSGYSWSVTGGTGSSTTNSIDVTWGGAGAGKVTVTYTDSNGCNPVAATEKDITINSLPVPTISGPSSACANSTQLYTTESGKTNYDWTVTGGTITDGGDGEDNVQVTWGNMIGSGSVTITYTNANNCTAFSSPYIVTLQGVAQIVGGNIYCTLQDAIDNATTGQTVILLDDIGEGKITVDKDIILDGDGHILTSTSVDYGIAVTSPDVTIQDITVTGSGTFGIHQAPSCGGLVISNTTVTGCGASGFAMNCSTGIQLTDITSTNNLGNGVSILDCHDVTINGITTSGNAFGGGFGSGIGIFSNGVYCPPAGSSNITVTGSVNISESPAIYEEATTGTITGVVLPSGFTHYAGTYPVGKAYYTSLSAALTAADLLLSVYPSYQPAVYVKEVGGNHLYVAKNTLASVDMALKAAILAASAGDIIHINSGIFTEIGQIVVNKDLTIEGAGLGSTIIKTNQNTGASGDARGWWLVNGGVNLHLNDMTIDGSGYLIWQGIRHLGSGTINNVEFVNIKYQESGPSYSGVAVAAFGSGTANVNITNSVFSEIGRVGVLYYGAGITGSNFHYNTYTGKGEGNWLDYMLDISAGAVVDVLDCEVSGNKGVASSDGSTSAGILVTTLYGAGTTATITNSIFHDNTTGIAVGYDGIDVSTVVAHNNQFYNNEFGITSTNPLVNAENNWWGAPNGPYANPEYTCGTGNEVDGPVDFIPWCTDASCSGSTSGLATAVHNTTKDTYYCTIQDAIADANPNNMITVAAGTYVEVGQILIDKNLTITGTDKTTTIIKPDVNQTNWFQVNAGVTFNLSKVKLDGTGRVIENAINYLGNGLVDNCWLTEIKGAAKYDKGTALQVENLAAVNISNCTFDNIGRNGVRHRGTGTVSGNNYTGKGAGDWLDYFILAEYGCDITIDGNTVTNCTGEATLDGSTSSAIAVWDDPDTKAIITNNILTNNTTGIGFAGVNSTDPAYPWPQATIGNGNFITGGDYGILLGAWGTKYNPVLTFGSTTLKGQTVQAILMDENVGIGSNYDISSVIIKDALDAEITDNFEKEDIINHALDGLNRGLFVWVPSNVYVTTSTLGIQRGIDVVPNSTVNIGPGTFNEDVNVNKNGIHLLGSGIDVTYLRGTYSGNNFGSAACLFLNANDILVQDMTITRDYGADLAAWYACAKNQGVTFGQTKTGNVLNQVRVVDQRNAVYINNAQDYTVTNSTIENNRTGFQMGNNISGGIITNNYIRNNFTHGLMINFDLGVVNGANLSIEQNSFSGNWYSEVYYHGTNTGSFTGADFSCNWYGIASPTVNPTAAGEPGYASQVPPQFGGTSPGPLVDEIRGTKAGLITNSPWLTDGSDGSGVGFQPTGTCNGSPIEITSAIPDHIICGETTGSILISWTGGVADYTVDWGGIPVSGIAINSFDITGLAAGNYTLVVTDTYGNSDTYGPVIVQYLPVTNTTPDPDTYWPTIQAAVTAAAPGDNIQICAGLYKESNITVNKPLTIEGLSKTGVILAPAALNNPTDASFPTGYQYGFLIGSSDVTIKNLTIDGEANTDLGAGHNYHGGVMTDHRLGILYNNITVQDIIVQHTYRRGIQIFSNIAGTNSTGHLVTLNTVQDVTLGPGIVIFDGHNTISNNTIQDIPDGSGIEQVQWNGPGSVNTIIKGNVISNVYTGIQSVWASSTSMIGGLTPADGNTINLTGAKDDIGIILRDAIGGATVQNNIVTGSNEDAGIWLYREGTSGNPVLVKDNTLTASSSTSSNSGFATGIFAVDDKAFVNGSTDNNPVYANLSGNKITGFQTGVELHASGTEPVGMVSATIQNNEISGSAKAVYLNDHNGATNGYSVSAIINNNNLSGNTLVVDASTIPGSLVDATCNWWGTTDPYIIANAVSGDVQFLPFSTSASPMNCSGIGPVVNTTNDPDRSYMTIQAAIDDAATVDGDVIEVAAGTYIESIYIYKDLTLLGPNAGKNPNTDLRDPEAIIQPVEWYNVYLDVAGVTIDGFTLDGLGTCDYGIYAYVSGAGGHLFTNNIVKGYNVMGYIGWVQSGAPSSQNLVTRNLFKDMPNARAVVTLWNYYANVTNNVIQNTSVGIYAENANQPESTGLVEWKNNNVSASRSGIWYNLAYGTATSLTIKDNTINVEDNVSGTRWDGIWLTSLGGSINPTISGNTIIGGTVTQQTNGYHMWNNTTTATNGITVQGGSVSDVDYGIWINNWDGYPTVGGSNAGTTSALLDGLTIENAALAGVYLKDNPLNTSGASAFVYAKLTNSTISGSGTGVLIEGEDASADVVNNLATISGNEVGIRVKDGADLASCTGNTITNNAFGGIIIESTAGTIGEISGNNISGNGYLVDATHGLGLKYDKTSLLIAENNYWGFATGPFHTVFNTCGEGNAVVGNVDFMPWCTDEDCTGTSADLPVSNISKSPVAYYCTIQDAIDDAGTGGEIIMVGDGIFYENIVINKDNLTVKNSSSPIIDGGGSGVVVTIVANGVTFDGFTVRNSGSSPLTDGGIVLTGVTGCAVKNNNVSNNNGFGIALQLSNGNTLQNNTLNNNNIAGIGLLGSSNNTIKSNNVTGTNAFSGQYGYGIILDIVEIPSPSSPTFSTGNTIGHVTETPNNFSDNEGDGVYFGWGCNLNTILKNTINSNGNDGIFFWKSGSNTVTGNTITGNIAEGIQLTASPNNIITGNTITSSNKGIWIKSGWTQYQPHTAGHEALSSGNSINNNNISGNSAYGVEYVDNPGGMEGGSFVPYPYDDNIVIDAEDNWWGSNTGPTYSGNPCGTGDAVSNNVGYNPWQNNDAMEHLIYQLIAYEVSGTTSLCIGGTTTITLSGSQLGSGYDVIYSLYANNVLVEGSEQTGTGDPLTPLTWTIASAENTIYTVKAENSENGCILDMTGSAAVFIGPITTAGSVLAACPGSNIQIPVTVTDFAGVGAISLVLNYDPLALTYVSSADTLGLQYSNNIVGGVGNIVVSKFLNPGDTPLTLPDGATLFTMTFTYLGGTTGLAWNDTDDAYCEYAAFAPGYLPFCDDPTSTYYINGQVTEVIAPVVAATVTGPDGDIEMTGGNSYAMTICSGEEVTTSDATSTSIDPSSCGALWVEMIYTTDISTLPATQTVNVPMALVTPATSITPENHDGIAKNITFVGTPYYDINTNGELDAGDYEGLPITYVLTVQPMPEISGTVTAPGYSQVMVSGGNYAHTICSGVEITTTAPSLTSTLATACGDLRIQTVYTSTLPNIPSSTVDQLYSILSLLPPTTISPENHTSTIQTITFVSTPYYDADNSGNLTTGDILGDLTTFVLTVNPQTEVTEVTLQSSTDEFTWDAVSGNLGDGYSLCIDPGIEFFYVDVNTLISNPALSSTAFEQNAFYLTDIDDETAFFEYWDAKGVNSGATGWQGVMWGIINGDEPMFYINYTGSDYQLIDGLQYQIGQGIQTLRISGDYPQDSYTFSGSVADINGCESFFDVFFDLNTIPEVTDVTLLSSIDDASWTAVAGDFTTGFNLCIDDANEYYYLDIDGLDGPVSPLLTTSFIQNAFYLAAMDNPTDFFAYWSAKGVVSGAGGWQGVMWNIISGAQPMFYINYTGSDYQLIDGLQYQIGNGAQTLRVSGDYPQDHYTFNGSVTDENGCVSSFFDVFFDFNTVPYMVPVSNQEYCNDATTLATTLNATVEDCTFEWINSNTDIGLTDSGNGIIPSFTATNTTNAPISGMISVRPTSPSGCVGAWQELYTITVFPTPTMTDPADQAVCNGAPTAEVVFNGPVSGTTYEWINSLPSIGLAASGTGDIASFTAVNNTSAIVTATITVTPWANGCAGTQQSFDITVYPTPDVVDPLDQALCNQSTTTAVVFSGSVTGTVFEWVNDTPDIGLVASGSGDIPTFTAQNDGAINLVATITVTPTANGCAGTPQSFTFTVYPTPAGTIAITTPIGCNGGSGTVTITATVGTAPFEYTFNGITNSTGVFTGIVAGTGYEWYISDVHSCVSEIGLLDVTQPTVLTGGASETSPILCNGGNATITMTAGGGTTPYTYTFNGSSVTTVNTTQTFSVVAGLGYAWSVTDANSCGPVTGSLDVAEPALLTGGASETSPILCNGGNATITMTAGGGTTPYTYTFNGSSVTTVNTTQTFSVVAGLGYAWSVTDANSCGPVTGSLDVAEPALLTGGASETSPILCNGGNATITMTAGGGTTPYTYTFNGSSVTTVNTTQTFSVVAGLGYLWSVTDVNSCGPVTGSLDVAEPALLTGGASETSPILCNGGNATITMTAGGGTTPYTYTFNGSSVTTVNTTQTFSVVAGLGYLWSVTDVNSCGPVTGSLDVAEPALLTGGASETSPILCNGGNATITMTAGGGTTPYTYTFNGSSVTTVNTTQTFSVVAGLGYLWSVTDVNSCGPVTGSLDVAEPALLTGGATVTSPITCFGGTATVTMSASGGTPPYSYTFNGVTNSNGIFIGILAGINYPWSVTDANACGPVIGNLTVTEPAAIPISGTVKYYNGANTVMNNVIVDLKQGGTVIHTATTNGSGAYSFANVCPGTYDVVFTTGKPVGGINTTDAALVNAWPVSFYPIEKALFFAGDVTNNNRILGNDATSIQQYFLSLPNPTPFPRSKWSFWKTNDMVSANNPPVTVLTLTVPPASAPITQNFWGMVTGDFNQSFVPGGAKAESESLALNYANTMEVESSTEFELPIRTAMDMQVGAVSLILNYPSDQLEVLGVYLTDNPALPVDHVIYGDELRISWFSMAPINLNNGEALITLQLKSAAPLSMETMYFSLAADPLNELANGQYQVINPAVLTVDIVKAAGLGIYNPYITSDDLTMSNYPNPFNEITTINYILPDDGKVILDIYDLVGNKVRTLVDETQTAGEYKVKVNLHSLQLGSYTATLRLQGTDATMSKTIKIISK